MQMHFESEEKKQTLPEFGIESPAAGVEEVQTAASEQEEETTASEQHTQIESIDVLLPALKRQSRRHAWFAGIAMLLGGLLGFTIAMGICIYFMMGGLAGHAASLSVDFSLLGFGVTGQGGAGQAHMTVSGLTPLLLLLGSGTFAALTKRERVKLTRTLLRYEDLRAVGPLVEALYLRDKKVRSQAAAALTRLLPKLRPEDASLLDSHQRLLLSLYLGRSRWALLEDNDDLSLAIVEAYMRIGDGSELPTVRRLAEGKGSAAKDSRVREAAQRYVAERKRRAEEARLPQTLLRASSPLGTAPDVLLRPAGAPTSTQPDQLLRAASEDAPPPV